MPKKDKLNKFNSSLVLPGTPDLELLAKDSFRPNGAIKKNEEEKLTFDELKEIEAKRREILLRVSNVD